MDVNKAIVTRRSIRAFKPQPVPKETLQAILDAARWSPSGMNIQPWNCCVVTGKTLETLKSSLVEKAKTAEGKPEIPWYDFGEAHNERRKQLGISVMKAKGIGREDKAKRAEWNLQMLRFFDAPAAIMIYTERRLGSMALFDVGFIAHAIMLLAHEAGLGTCVVGLATSYPDMVRSVLNIPDDSLIVAGLAVGYPDPAAPINQFERERAALDSFVQWRT